MSKKINVVKGDIFKLMQPGDAMVHGCNAQGVMGSGIAATVRDLYPGAYDYYRKVFQERGLKLGEIIDYFDPKDRVWILNGITQNLYGRDGSRFVSYDAVAEVFSEIARSYQHAQIKNLFLPLIGAGLGGGNWKIIQTIVEQELKDTDLNVTLVLFKP